jgi:hypothetical protein
MSSTILEKFNISRIYANYEENNINPSEIWDWHNFSKTNG